MNKIKTLLLRPFFSPFGDQFVGTLGLIGEQIVWRVAFAQRRIDHPASAVRVITLAKLSFEIKGDRRHSFHFAGKELACG
jgi:hypothetical protein